MIESLESRIAPATFVVTNFADIGTGTLREAISLANDSPGADVIIFKKGLTGTIAVREGAMLVTETLAIKGPGADKIALDADFGSRFLNVTDTDTTKDSPFSVSGLAFYQGKAAGGDGGAILSSESLTVKNCAFGSNEATNTGGAISVNHSGVLPIQVDIRGSQFFGNRVLQAGGGALCVIANDSVNGSVTLKQNLFANNRGGLEGGAVILGHGAGSGERFLIEKCRFVENLAELRGGAVSLLAGDSDQIAVRGSLFSGNNVEGAAGGMLINGGNIRFEDNVMSRNSAPDTGGGLMALNLSSLTIRGSRFTENICDEGGALALSLAPNAPGPMRIINSLISGNQATFGGGLILSPSAGPLEIHGTTITGNHAEHSGGGLLIVGSGVGGPPVTITGSKLTSNTAGFTGGGLADGGRGQLTIKSSKVLQNSAAAGGGIHLFKNGHTVIVNSLIAENHAESEDGGGISALGSLELHGTRILNNSASTVGGGIRTLSELTLDRCVVARNVSVEGGGIFRSDGPPLVLTKTKIVGNLSADGQQVVTTRVPGFASGGPQVSEQP
jgi:hypothetical protein